MVPFSGVTEQTTQILTIASHDYIDLNGKSLHRQQQMRAYSFAILHNRPANNHRYSLAIRLPCASISDPYASALNVGIVL